jgi:hypothetical protein
MVGYYIPLQQHLSTSFFASLHNNFPFFCCWQQQIFTSLPVSVHVIFGDAANPTPAIANTAITGSHFVLTFINSPPSIFYTLSLHLGVVSKVNYLFSKS